MQILYDYCIHHHATNYPSVNKTRIYPRTMVNIMVIQTLIMFIIS